MKIIIHVSIGYISGFKHFNNMYQHLKKLQEQANLSKEYVQRNKIVNVKKSSICAQLIDPSICSQIVNYPLYNSSLNAEQIYKYIVAIYSTSVLKDGKKTVVPIVNDLSIKQLTCRTCSHSFQFERYYSNGDPACPNCGACSHYDIFEGDHKINHEGVIPQYSNIYDSNDLNTVENHIYPYTNQISLNHDQNELVKKIVLSKTSLYDPDSNLIVAAIIYATNPDLNKVGQIKLPIAKVKSEHQCKVCQRMWSSKKDSIWCCKFKTDI